MGAGEWRGNLIYSSPESLESMWIQIETEDEMTRELAAPTSPSFSLRTSMSQMQGFAFVPEALPGNRSMLKQSGYDRAGSRLSSASDTAIEYGQLMGGGGFPGARRPENTSI